MYVCVCVSIYVYTVVIFIFIFIVTFIFIFTFICCRFKLKTETEDRVIFLNPFPFVRYKALFSEFNLLFLNRGSSIIYSSVHSLNFLYWRWGLISKVRLLCSGRGGDVFSMLLLQKVYLRVQYIQYSILLNAWCTYCIYVFKSVLVPPFCPTCTAVGCVL